MNAIRSWRLELVWVIAVVCVATFGLSRTADAQFSCDPEAYYHYERDINLCLWPSADCISCDFVGELP